MTNQSLDALTVHLAPFGAVLVGSGSVPIADVEQDSRRVRPGALFVARVGQQADGRSFVDAAISNGAAAVMVERGYEFACAVPVLTVAHLDIALGVAAEFVHGNPSRQLQVVGITGTNGKTTTASLTSQALQALGLSAAQLGTLGFTCGAVTESGALTTPPADAVSRYLARAARAGANTFVMEVSSHALAAHRVDALTFAVGAFTNLTQDHLDFHGTMEAYGEAKARLFCELNPGASVINIDDPWGLELSRRAPTQVLTVGRHATADIALLQESSVAQATSGARMARLVVSVRGQHLEFETPIIGRHNADNWLLCLGILSALGVDLARLPTVSRDVRAVPGRLERCDGVQDDVAVFVDYAHTPDALERALAALRPLTGGSLWCVFGCGGDRDAKKRPLMGEVATRLADRSLITSDNPRTELPETIIADIVAGTTAGADFETVVDRTAAIDRALEAAAPGDLVLIAGKGHEDYQIIGRERFPFDDRQQARRALAARRARRGMAGT